MNNATQPRVAVLAPLPILTITVEAVPHGDEVHIHAGGQGFWIARMIAALGLEARLVGAFGGEAGDDRRPAPRPTTADLVGSAGHRRHAEAAGRESLRLRTPQALGTG